MAKFIDLSYLNDVSGEDAETKKQLIAIFIEQISEISSKLESALKDSDYQELNKASHTAKSTLRIMGINDLASKMELLQNLTSKQEKPETYQQLVDEFLKTIPWAIDELKQELSKKRI